MGESASRYMDQTIVSSGAPEVVRAMGERNQKTRRNHDMNNTWEPAAVEVTGPVRGRAGETQLSKS